MTQTLIDILSILSSVATILGVPFAILVYLREQKKARLERQAEICSQAHGQYQNYLQLCFDNPELDIFDYPYPSNPDPLNSRKELIAYTMLISIFESAYRSYQSHPDPENSEWVGWNNYIRWWMSRPKFKLAWEKDLSSQFETSFIKFVNDLEPYEPGQGEPERINEMMMALQNFKYPT